MTIAVKRAVDILVELRAAGAPQSLTEVAQAAALPIPTVRRLLMDLREADLVSYDSTSRRYALGLGLLDLASGLWQSGTMPGAVAQAMAGIRDRTGLTCEFSVLRGRARVVVWESPSSSPLRYANGVGSSAPLHAGAAGRALLAFCDGSIRTQVLDGVLEQLTPSTITSRGDLLETLTGIREHGYAYSLGERAAGVAAVAVPIFDVGGNIASSVLAVVGPEQSFPAEIEKLAGQLIQDVRRVSVAAPWGAA